MTKSLTAALLLGALASVAQAQPNKDFAAMGIGTSTCTQFANLYKGNPQFAENLYFTWAQGFLSSWNMNQMVTKQPYWNLGSLTTTEQETLLRQYCDQHPLGNFVDAIFDLLTHLEMKTQGPR
jgi:hypothetical protein